jgi:hypothetical protein
MGTNRSGRWYHGGPPIPGRWLLPPSITGAPSGALIYAAIFGATPWADGVEADRASQAHVFLTSELLLARAHAATIEPCGRGPMGVVYECWPASLDPDPDLADPEIPGQHIQTPFATIVRVVEAPVEMSLARVERAFLRYSTPAPGFTKADMMAANAEFAAALARGEHPGLAWHNSQAIEGGTTDAAQEAEAQP